MSAIDVGIDLWLRSKKLTTRLQYAAHLGQLRAALAHRDKTLATATRADIVRFVRSYQSYWARKRALIAVRSCYKFLFGKKALAMNIAASLTITDIESDADALLKDAQLQLFEAGWEKGRIDGLTWKSLIALTSEESELPAPARNALYRLAARRLLGRQRSMRNSAVFPLTSVEKEAS